MRRSLGWPDGETYDELGRRVVSELFEIAGRHPRERVLAVTHGGPIRSALAAAAGHPFDTARSEIAYVDKCAVVRIAVRDGKLEPVD